MSVRDSPTWPFALFVCLLWTSVVRAAISGSPDPLAKSQVRVEKGVEWYDLSEPDSDDLIYKWTQQAVSGVMAAMASKNLPHLSAFEARELETCSKAADTLEKHARCVVPVLSAAKTRRTASTDASPLLKLSRQSRVKQLIPTAFDTTGPERSTVAPKPISVAKPFKSAKIQKGKKLHRHRFSSAKVLNMKGLRKTGMSRLEKLNSKWLQRRHSNRSKSSSRSWSMESSKSQERRIGAFTVSKSEESRVRIKRLTPRSDSSYEITSSQSRLTPIGGFAKFLMAGLLEKKNKTRTPWQESINRAKMTAWRKKELKQRAKDHIDENPLENLAFRALENRNLLPQDVEKLMEDLSKDKKLLAAERARGYKASPTKRAMGLMRDGLKLAYMIAGKNVTNFDEKTIKLLSPRFFSVTSEDGSDKEGDELDMVNLLSPSILSLHSNGTGMERKLSLPNLVAGFTTADQQQWLDLIFEAAGVEEAVAQADEAVTAQEFQTRKKRSYEERMRSEDGKPLYFTKERAVEVLGAHEGKRIEHHEQLIRSYSAHQMRAMNESGFAVLSPSQLRHLYGPGSPHADPDRLRLFLSMNESQVLARIEKDIFAVAQGKTHRHKRAIVGSPFLFSALNWSPQLASQPIILSPILFTWVVGSPAVLGPVILGPWLFLPLVLSPRVLSPAILNPLGFVPVVLSPLVLHPAILCPGIFNPFVLSPMVMVPFILSPQVFTPIILSPLVMSPFILNPSVGTPLILSPFVLTPVIYSPLTLFALVLSPNALSPLVESKLTLAEVVLSPSWMS